MRGAEEVKRLYLSEGGLEGAPGVEEKVEPGLRNHGYSGLISTTDKHGSDRQLKRIFHPRPNGIPSGDFTDYTDFSRRLTRKDAVPYHVFSLRLGAYSSSLTLGFGVWDLGFGIFHCG